MEADCLSTEDWIVLTNIHHFLKFFHQATLATEGHTATLERVLSTMEFLLEQLEIGKLEYSNDSYISCRECNPWHTARDENTLYLNHHDVLYFLTQLNQLISTFMIFTFSL